MDRISELEIALHFEGAQAAGAKYCYAYIVKQFIIRNRLLFFNIFRQGFNCFNLLMKMSEFTTFNVY